MLGSEVPWESSIDTPLPSEARHQLDTHHELPTRRHRMLAIHRSSSLKPLSNAQSNSPGKEPSFYSEDIDKYALIDQQPVTLQSLLQICEPPLTEKKLLDNAQFLSRERPVRYAKRVKLFQRLPYIVNLNPYINSVYRVYYENFEESRRFPMVESLADEHEFIKMLARHSQTLKDIMPQIARGFYECRRYFGTEDRKRFVDQLIKMRIGLRLLTSQHIALYDQLRKTHSSIPPNQEEPDEQEPGRYQGIVDNKLHLSDMARVCAQSVQAMCEMSYGDAPSFTVDGCTDAIFRYIPGHLDYMLTELLKNAFKSSMDRSLEQDGKVPPVLITISKGNGRVAIRIRDSGGGIPREIHSKIFDYSFTTTQRNSADDNGTGENGPPTDHSAISGLGFGLPMTKIYAEYFGGALNLISLEGYGCDAFLELPSIQLSRTPAIQI